MSTEHLDPNKRDFSANARLPGICGLAAVIGVLGTVAAIVLLKLIYMFTNVFFFGTFSFVNHSPADNQPGGWVVVLSGLGRVLGRLHRALGSEKIRRHGIPEAIEAILF